MATRAKVVAKSPGQVTGNARPAGPIISQGGLSASSAAPKSPRRVVEAAVTLVPDHAGDAEGIEEMPQLC